MRRQSVSWAIKKITVLVLATITFIFSHASLAVPTLRSADLAVVMWGTDLDDEVMLLALADIPGNSVIFLTDEGWGDNGLIFDGSEDVYKWTVHADGIAAGSLIPLTNQSTTVLEFGLSGYPGKSFNFGSLAQAHGSSDMTLSAGDQLLIYQTTDNTYNGAIQRLGTNGSAEPGMIYAFSGNEVSASHTYGWSDSGSQHSGSSSQLPDYMEALTTSDGSGNASTANANGMLTLGDMTYWDEYAYGIDQGGYIEGKAGEQDNYVYNGPYSEATKSEWLVRIHTTKHWLASDKNPFCSINSSNFDCGTLDDVIDGQGEMVVKNEKPLSTGGTITIQEDMAYIFEQADFHYSDVETSAFTQLRIDTLPVKGSLTFDGQVAEENQVVLLADITAGKLKYKPVANEFGQSYASFTYSVHDGVSFADSAATITVKVIEVNDQPEIELAAVLSTKEDTATSISFNYTDADGDTVTATQKTAPTNGRLTINGTTLTYTPKANYAGSDRFAVTLSDGNGFSVDKTVNVTVNEVNDQPEIELAAALSTKEDTTASISFSYTDNDGDTVTATQKTAPTNGSLTIIGNTLTYTPKANYVGADQFVVTFSDGNGYKLDRTVTVTVTGTNDEPEIQLVSTATTNKNTAVTLSFTYTDADGDVVTASVAMTPSNGSLMIAGTRLTYTPEKSFTGEDRFTVTLTDGNGFSAEYIVVVTVNSVNTAPLAINDTFELIANKEGRYLLDVLANDTDADNDELQLLWVTTDRGTATIEDGQIALQSEKSGDFTLKYGITDGEEGTKKTVIGTVQVTIGTNAVEVPHVTAPPAVEVNATGLFTKVDLGVAKAVDRQGNPLPVSLLDQKLFFRPGTHTVNWYTTDAEGNQGKASQQVTVHPQVSIAKDDESTEGTQHTVKVFLNGNSPAYPVVIPYTVGGSSDEQDHTLQSEELIIKSGTEGKLTFSVLADDIAEGRETLTITLADSLNLGSKSHYLLNIQEENVAPKVNIAIRQNGELRSVVERSDQLVSITAEASNANAGDTLQYHWINEHAALANTSQDETAFVFSAQQVEPGIYPIRLEVNDSGGLTVATDIFIEVVTRLAVLDHKDSDGDLIPDIEEGYLDSDNDGIADYLDAIAECNVLQGRALESTRYLLEGEPGACLRKGVTLAENQTGGAELLTSELAADTDAQNIGGLYDFMVHGLPKAGQNFHLVLPQRLPVPANAVYRKYRHDTGWQDFYSDEHNYLSSAQGEAGYCPPPGDATWQRGLTEGHWCVQLTIEDGGPNDDDGVANRRILDPGGVSVTATNNLPVAQSDIATTTISTMVQIDVLANDSDADGDTLTLIHATADFGTVSIDSRILSYSPAAQFYGTDTIRYSISDGNGGTAHAEVQVIVAQPAETEGEDSGNGSSGGDTDGTGITSSGGSTGLWVLLMLVSAAMVRNYGGLIKRLFHQ